MLIDAHCHLDQVDDPDDAVRQAVARGVGKIVAVSQDLPSMQQALALRDRHPGVVLAGLGIHPQLIPGMSDGELDTAFRFLESHLEGADVLGEVGLDYKVATTEEEQRRQRAWLDRQLELAALHRKPINLHSRRALRQVMNTAISFRNRSACPAQLHWFTHSKKLVRITNEAGIYVSAGPATLHGDDSRAVAATVGADLLLTETDCPVPFGGASARPHWIAEVVRCLAEARGEEPEVLEGRIEANFARLMAGGSPRQGGP